MERVWHFKKEMLSNWVAKKKKKIDRKKDSMINSGPQWIPLSHHFFLTPIIFRAVYRKWEHARSEILFTFSPSRTLQVSVQMQIPWARTTVGAFRALKMESLFLSFPCLYQLPKTKERENKQAAFLSYQSTERTHYTQGARNHLEFLHLHALSQQLIEPLNS